MSDFEFSDLPEIEGETELAPPQIYAAQSIEWAADRHATDLFVSDDARSVVIAVRRMGRIEEVRRLAREYGRRLRGHFRAIADAGAGDLVHPAEGRGRRSTRVPAGSWYSRPCMPTSRPKRSV